MAEPCYCKAKLVCCDPRATSLCPASADRLLREPNVALLELFAFDEQKRKQQEVRL